MSAPVCPIQAARGWDLVLGSLPDLPRPVSQDSSLASVIVGIIQVLFTAMAALIMDRAGRRLLLVLSGEACGQGLSYVLAQWSRPSSPGRLEGLC